MPLPFENNTVSYADFLYSGSEDSGMLRGGVGQLVDGVTGTLTLDTNERRFPWVGWTTPLEEIIFDFGSLHQFGSVSVHSYFNSLGVRWFNTIEVAISQNMEQWNAFSRQLNDLRGPQNAMVPTVMTAGSTVEGRYVRLRFDNFQGSGLMLISEVSFDSTAGEFTILITACFHNPTHSALFVCSFTVPPSPPVSIDGIVVGVIVAIVALIVVIITASLTTFCIIKKRKMSTRAPR